jgi:hypothetical protein
MKMERFNFQDFYLQVFELLEEREVDRAGSPIPKTKEELEKIVTEIKNLADVALSDYLADEYV